MLSRGMKPVIVRRANQRALLLIISREPGVSNAELSRRSGLAPQTVSAVLTDLENDGLLVRGPARRGKRGQPATPVYLNPAGAFAVGAEIGWGHIEVVLMNLGRERLGHYRREYEYPDARTILDELGTVSRDLLSKLGAAERRRLVGIGVAVPGGVGDPASLKKLPVEQELLWQTMDVEARVAEVTGLDVNVYNDGNAACFAEVVANPGPYRPESFIYLLIDTFVAAGIVAEGRLWEGATGRSANLGSMLVTDRHGVTRFVHEIASLHALRRQLTDAGEAFEDALADVPPPGARKVLDEWIEDSSLAIAKTILNAATVIECEAVILEAQLPRHLVARLLEATERQLAQIPSLGVARPLLQSGHVGGSGAAQGAAQLWMYRRYFSRELEFMDV